MSIHTREIQLLLAWWHGNWQSISHASLFPWAVQTDRVGVEAKRVREQYFPMILIHTSAPRARTCPCRDIKCHYFDSPTLVRTSVFTTRESWVFHSSASLFLPLMPDFAVPRTRDGNNLVHGIKVIAHPYAVYLWLIGLACFLVG